MNLNLLLAAYVTLLAVLLGWFLRFAKRRIRIVAPALAPASADFTAFFAQELEALAPALELPLADIPSGAAQVAPLPSLRRADLDLLAKVNAITRVANPAASEPLN